MPILNMPRGTSYSTRERVCHIALGREVSSLNSRRIITRDLANAGCHSGIV